MAGIASKGIKKPTPIQAVVIPILQTGRSLIGISKTGSGKSLAFILPAILKCIEIKKKDLDRDPKRDPLVLVLSPVRELATQLETEVSAYSRGSVSMHCVYGGKEKKNQEMGFFRGLDILVATPGRINDFLGDRTIGLSHVKYLVLDEADQLLNLGFYEQIKDILDTVHKDCQIALFSATWPHEFDDIARKYMQKAVKVSVGLGNH